MSTGDVLDSKRPRFEPQERFDVIDALFQSEAPRELIDAIVRAIFVTPLATAGAAVGTLFTGGSTTNNPTGAGDGKLRINSELLVGIDSNGRSIIKPSGTTVDITIPAGNQQVYLYFQETSTDNAPRKFSNSLTPFSEYGKSIYTKFQGSYGVFVRAGTAGTIVASAVISSGITSALLFLGIANNTAGTVTFSRAAATNRLSTITQPSSFPLDNISNGSMKTMLDLIKASLYRIGRSVWKRSSHLTLSDSNNNGAYEEQDGLGVDASGRFSLEVKTIGNGTLIFGRFDRSDYADATALFQAAVDSIPAGETGIIFIKQDVTITGFHASNAVTISDNKTVIIQGTGAHNEGDTFPQIILDTAATFLLCSVEGVNIIFKDILIARDDDCTIADLVGTLEIHNSIIKQTTATASPPTMFTCAADFGSGDISKIICKDSIFIADHSAVSATAWFISDGGGADFSYNIYLDNCQFICRTVPRPALTLSVVKENLHISNCDFLYDGDTSPSGTKYHIVLSVIGGFDSNDNKGFTITDSQFKGGNSSNARMSGINIENMPYVTVSKCHFIACEKGVSLGGSTTAPRHEGQKVIDCIFDNTGTNAGTGVNSISSGAIRFAEVRNCIFRNMKLVWSPGFSSGNNISNSKIIGNVFLNAGALPYITVYADVIEGLIIADNDLEESTKSLTATQGLDLVGDVSIINTQIKGNRFKGFYAKNSDNTFFAMSCSAALLSDVFIENNSFDDINNVETNLTTAAANCPRVLEVLYADCQNVSIKGNKAKNLMATNTNLADTPNNGAWLMVDSVSHSANQSTKGTKGLLIADNDIGDASSPMAFIHLPKRVRMRDITISRNRAEMSVISAVVDYEFSLVTYGLAGNVIAAAVTAEDLRIENNSFRLASAAGASALLFIFLIGANATTTIFVNVKITDNSLKVSGAGGLSGNAITFSTILLNALIFKHNSYSRDADVAGTGDPKEAAVFPAAGIAIPTQPGGGSDWPDNIRLVG